MKLAPFHITPGPRATAWVIAQVSNGAIIVKLTILKAAHYTGARMYICPGCFTHLLTLDFETGLFNCERCAAQQFDPLCLLYASRKG